MIFLTVGSEIAFDRLVQAVDIWSVKHPEIEIFGQIAEPGDNGYRPRNFPWGSFISATDYNRYCAKSELIIAHAGMGSIITALVTGRPILIMPRKMELRETRNDHQVATAEKFSNRTGILIAEDETRVGPALDLWRERKQNDSVPIATEFADEKLITAIRKFILGETSSISNP